ncbi:MAG: hypothetical protein Q8J80_03565 [Gallionella sp.]|nr:hypothetical protein [Gallionella sp.]
MRSTLFRMIRKSKLLVFIIAVNFIAKWLKAQGYDRSLQTQKAIDAKDAPLPWYSYPLIEYLRQFDLSNIRVFEYGSGHSTLFWASKCAEVVAVEHNPEWYEYMRGRLPGNVRLLLREGEDEYASAIKEVGGEFQIIVIDGEWRLRCAQQSLGLLSPHGMFLVDNSDWFVDTNRYLRSNGFFQIDFNGPGPINRYAWASSLFLRAPTDLQKSFSDPLPLAGIRQKVNEHE